MNKVYRLLRELEPLSRQYWAISPETGRFLNLFIKFLGIKTVLEIGSGSGYSGIWLAEALSQNSGQLYTMESHKKERYPLACSNYKKSGLKNITAILGHAPEDIPQEPKTFDLAFFDATKYEHASYFDALKKRCKIIIADNASSHPEDLATFVNKLRKDKNWSLQKINLGTGLLIATRKTGE